MLELNSENREKRLHIQVEELLILGTKLVHVEGV